MSCKFQKNGLLRQIKIKDGVLCCTKQEYSFKFTMACIIPRKALKMVLKCREGAFVAACQMWLSFVIKLVSFPWVLSVDIAVGSIVVV